MHNPYNLEGKRILVTGASSGIGKATAIECSKLGANVIITDRDNEKLLDTYKQLIGSGHDLQLADLCIEEDLTRLINNITEINGLVNAAGIIKTIPFQFVNRADILDIFNINFFAPVILSQKIVKLKKIQKESSIVFISSIDGPITGHVGNSIYAASKGAVSAVAKSMAVELASKKIRVNCILPGITETPLIYTDSVTEDQFENEKKLYPLNRFGKPEEIALAIIYLLSDASNWVTGSNLLIDGGFTLQ